MKTQEIEKYIESLQKDELVGNNISNAVSANDVDIKLIRQFNSIFFMIRSFLDCIQLVSSLLLNRSVKEKHIVYTARNLCAEVDGAFEDRIVKPLFQKNVIWINYSKDYYMPMINNAKAYNIGGVVKFLCLCLNIQFSRRMRIFLAYRAVNNMIIRLLDGNDVFTLCYYDLNGLSLAFSNYRNKIKLYEIQHGSIINYSPYVNPSPIMIADVFYVKNIETIEYLRTHMCKNYNPEYRLIPYPSVDRKIVCGINILYASTVEFNGLHPVLCEFLAKYNGNDLNLIVRLHPREQENESKFRSELEQYHVRYEFDRSNNWLEGNTIKNLIIVSPWSSVIEDAYDNNFISIVIDAGGAKRFRHLIDGKKCIYSSDLLHTINCITKPTSDKNMIN